MENRRRESFRRATGNHEGIYRRHPDVGAIINAYPVNATALSVTGVPLDTRTIPESYLVTRHIGRVAHGVQFEDSEALAREISARQPAAILENDGVLVTGADILDTFDRLEVLERLCRVERQNCKRNPTCIRRGGGVLASFPNSGELSAPMGQGSRLWR
jgi:ribulose-5-phosphate 4-epimerase/fuculose-1-phosphate aldolase